jgi:hypothetical protein
MSETCREGEGEDGRRTFIFLNVFVTISRINALSSANNTFTLSGLLLRAARSPSGTREETDEAFDPLRE